MASLRFIVIADSHIRFPDDEVEAYPSNALMARRNEYVVQLCNQIDAAFVVHLGDIVHPLPVEDGHEPAVRLAAGIYEKLRHPIHFVPGNHDVGDKPNALVAVPPVAEENYATYEQYWGSPFGSFDVDACHFVIVDTPILNSGFDREEKQRAWLEHDLAAAATAGRRIFLFTHYPPFVRDHHESAHYDNLGEPARSWLLGLLEQYEVEAVFSGHVHNFLYNHHEGTELYVVPSTGFVRPDYSELAAIAPSSENGRNDPPKLGFFVVEVGPDGHTIRPIRTGGAVDPASAPPVALDIALAEGWESPVGVTLRHGWMTSVAFPTSGLDEFSRKVVRNDTMLPALWEARIHHLRIPVGDLATPEGRARIRHLSGRGAKPTVRSAGVPDERTKELIASAADHLARWEIVAPPESFESAIQAVSGVPARIRLAVAPIVPLEAAETAVHHFVTSGFSPGGDGVLERWMALDPEGRFEELVFRVSHDEEVAEGVRNAAATAAARGRRAVVNVELPRATESRPFEDDGAVADRVGDAVAAALAVPLASVFLDAFMDQDRSYYPRHGLIDRSSNPRAALYRLIEVAAVHRG